MIDRENLERWDREHVWHPFTPMQVYAAETPLIIREARDCTLIDLDGREYLDGVSSLWCNVHGHRVAALDAAIREQLDLVAHSTLLGLGNIPSIRLARRLVEAAPPGLTRVFYSDDGATAVEVALKLAFQFWQQTTPAAPRKTRFLAGDKHVALQQVVRIDRIEPFEHGPTFIEEVCAAAAPLVASADAILVSDYGLGFAEPALVRAILARGRKPGARVAVDSRYRLFDHAGADVATPSEPEVEAMLGRPLSDESSIEAGGRLALDRLGARALILTRGSQGMLVMETGQPTRSIAAFGSGSVADVTGAGDTVIAALSLALAADADWHLAARLANAAAGIAVTRMGTATVSSAELRDALDRLPA